MKAPITARLLLFLAILVFVLAASLPPGPALAQEEDSEQTEDWEDITETGITVQGEELLVTAQRWNESLDDPPVFVDRIEMEQYEGRFVTTEEAISHAAGVNVRDFGGLGNLSTVSIRGSSSDQVAVLIDGVRINPAVGGGTDLSTIPPEHIERIEVIRGGDSAFFGEGAVGGVVNIVTKRASGKAVGSYGLTYGSYDTFRAAASRSQRIGRASTLISGTFLHSDGDFTFVNNRGTEFNEGDDFEDVRQNNDVNSGGLLLKARADIGECVNLSGQNELFASDKGIPGIVTYPSPHAGQRDLRNTTTMSLALSDVGAAGLGFKTRISHRYASMEYEDPQGEQTGVPLDNDQQEFAPEIVQTIQYLWGEHQVWTASGQFALNALRDEDFGDPERTTWSAALRDQVFFLDEVFTLVPAIRFDEVSDAGSQWSPKFGLSVKPLDWLAVKGNIGRSFRAPNFSELYFNQGFVQGNPDLKPERALNLDAGLQIRTSKFLIEGAYFRNEVEDLIEYVLISGFRYKPFNIGEARLEGFEGALEAKPVKYFSLAGSYTLTYAIDTTQYANRTDRQIPGRPRHKGYGRLAGHLGIFKPFVEFDYVGGNFITQANTKLIPERKLWNAGLILIPDDSVKISLEVKNLADENPLDVRGFPLPGRSIFVSVAGSF